MGSGEFEMWMRVELHAKKRADSQIEIIMQDCMTEDVISFIYVYFVDNSDAVKANSALQEDTKSQISDDLLASFCLHSSRSYEPNEKNPTFDLIYVIESLPPLLHITVGSENTP